MLVDFIEIYWLDMIVSDPTLLHVKLFRTSNATEYFNNAT